MIIRFLSHTSMWTRLAGVCVVGLAIALAGCGGNSDNTATTPAPTNYPTRSPNQGPGAPKSTMMASTSGGATTGESIFTQDCGRCHKIGSVGSGRIALDHIGKNRDKAWLTVQIRTPEQHHSRMPSFPPGRLSDKDLNTLLAYLGNQK
jgi:mono/diheme cytochrome c family protein